jgi:uncharacterized Zn-binding protein involved in type VI secretion
MPNIARMGDIAVGTCRAHKSPQGCSGPIVTGSSSFDVDGRPCARVGDVVSFNCGHSGVIASGSTSSTVDGKGIARVGDIVVGPMNAIIVAGSQTAECN